MKIYIRYIIKPYIYIFSLLFPFILIFYLLIELFDKLDNFLKAKLSLSLLGQYLLFNIPLFSLEIWPVVISLAAVLAIGFLAKGGEILAFRTLGFSGWRLVAPYLFLSFLLTIFFMGLEEIVLPQSTYKALYIWAKNVKKKKLKSLIIKGKLYFKGKHSFFLGRVVDNKGSFLRNIIYVEMNAENTPSLLIWAQEAHYKKGFWIFSKGLLEKKDISPEWFSEKKLKLEISPKKLLLVKRTPRTQHFKELLWQRKLLKKASLPTKEVEGEIAYRIFYPLMSPTLIFLSVPLVLIQRGKHSAGKGISLGCLAIFLGIFSFILFKALADVGLGSPFILLPLNLLILCTIGFLFFYHFKL